MSTPYVPRHAAEAGDAPSQPRHAVADTAVADAVASEGHAPDAGPRGATAPRAPRHAAGTVDHDVTPPPSSTVAPEAVAVEETVADASTRAAVPAAAGGVGLAPTVAADTDTVAPAGAPATPAAPTRPKHGPQRGPGAGPMSMGTGEKAVNFGPSLRRLLGYLRPDRVLIAVAILMAAIGVACNVAGPKILGRATNAIMRGYLGTKLGQTMPAGITTDQAVAYLKAHGKADVAAQIQSLGVVVGKGIDFHHLGMILLLALGLYLLGALLMFVQGYVLNSAVQRAMFRLREAVSHKLDKLPLSYFDAQPRGELLSRVTNDIDNIAQTLQQTLSQVLNALLTLIFVMVMMFSISWELGLISLVVVPVSAILAGVVGKQAQKRFVAQWAATGRVNAQVEEAYTGHALVKVFGRQREVEAAFEKENEAMYQSSFGAQFISGLIMPIMFFVGNLNYVAIAVIGGLKVAHGGMSVGDVQAFMQYSRQFTQPVTQVASMANLLQSGVASAERVFEVLDAAEQTPEATGTLPTPVQGRVVFDHVNFSYTPDQKLITDLSLVAEPGQTVAIVGPTGAGKTTLVNLLMRFYDVRSGRITLDGVDIASVPRDLLRDQMGMVLQDTWLFGGSIKDNIGYGRPGATDEEIILAAKAAYVDRFVHALPDGYDTQIDEEGSNVSAGEKQLITIARAFLSEPGLLILDEATSSVDTRTELLVQRAMTKLRANRTSFVIAHRLSTIRDADLILVMEHGDIVEQGSHQQLLAAKGAYYDLYQSQFNAAVDDDAA